MVDLKLSHLDFTVRYYKTTDAPNQDKVIYNLFNYKDIVTREGLFQLVAL